MWTALYAIADKYGAGVVMEHLKGILIPWFLEASPLRVYALASRWGLEEEAKIASRGTLTMDIFQELPREDAELMGGHACQRLYLLHFNRREAARALVEKHPRPSPMRPSCLCGFPPVWSGLVSALSQRVAARPWLTAEELYEEAAKYDYQKICSPTCCHSFRNMHVYFSSLLKGLSDLPQTV